MNYDSNYKLCLSCHERNNPGFNVCWKCGACFAGGDLVRRPETSLSISKQKPKPLDKSVILLILIGLTILLWAIAANGCQSVCAAALLFALLTILYAAIEYEGFRWFLGWLLYICLWAWLIHGALTLLCSILRHHDDDC